MAQAVEHLVLAIIVTDRGRREPNAALRFPDEPPDRREGTTVPYGSDDLLIQDSTIRNAVDAITKMLSEPLAHIVTAGDHDISAKRID